MEERQYTEETRAHSNPWDLLPSHSLPTEHELLLLSSLAVWTPPLHASENSTKSSVRVALHRLPCNPLLELTLQADNQDELEDPCHIIRPPCHRRLYMQVFIGIQNLLDR